MAHELRNRLGVMRNALYCLENLPQQTPEAEKYFQIIRSQILQSEKLIADLLETDRGQSR